MRLCVLISHAYFALEISGCFHYLLDKGPYAPTLIKTYRGSTKL